MKDTAQKNNKTMDWILRLVKGVFIGTGFVLPGVSGGALAAVFGIYERMVSFLAHITKQFKENLLFFLPVGIGGVIGIVALSFPLSFMLEQFEVQVLWFFIGCILGTLPALWKQAGKKGRSTKHYGVLAVSAVAGYFFLVFGAQALSVENMPQNFATWAVSGAIIGLGLLVPGLSPSNFLVYMGMYKPMVDAFKTIDLSVIIPLGIGGLVCVLAFSKLMDYLFSKIYTGLFHFVLGIVLASTVMIVPTNYNYLSLGTLACAAACAAGVALAYWMTLLDDKYKIAD